MKRRKFLKTVGATSIVFWAGKLYSYNYWSDKEVKIYPPEELKDALEKHFNAIINGENFNPNVLPLNGKMIIVKSYSIVINNKKNSIFDVAEIVVGKLKVHGFDATALKKGIIPENLGIGPGILRIPGSMFPIRVEELKNYDATLSFQNFCNIKTDVPPSEWSKIKSFDEEVTAKGLYIYSAVIGKKNFKLYSHPDREKPVDYRFNVSRLTPNVEIIDNVPNALLSYSKFINFLSPNIAKTLKLG